MEIQLENLYECVGNIELHQDITICVGGHEVEYTISRNSYSGNIDEIYGLHEPVRQLDSKGHISLANLPELCIDLLFTDNSDPQMFDQLLYDMDTGETLDFESEVEYCTDYGAFKSCVLNGTVTCDMNSIIINDNDVI